MKLDPFDVLGGLLFILSGIAIIAHVRLPIPLSPSLLLGTFFVTLGFSIALGASPSKAFVLSLAVITFILSLSGPWSNVSFEGGKRFSASYEGCQSFTIVTDFGELRLSTGAERDEVIGKAVSEEPLMPCGIRVCCSEVEALLRAPRELDVRNDFGRAEMSINTCVEELTMKNNFGSTTMAYRVPKNCSGKIEVNNNMGDVRIRLIVPEGVKVIYDIDSHLGSYSVTLPEGEGPRSGSYGKGNYTLAVRVSNSMGSVRLAIEER